MARSKKNHAHKAFLPVLFFSLSLLMILLLSYATISNSLSVTTNASEKCAAEKTNLERAEVKLDQAEQREDENEITRAEANLELRQRALKYCSSVTTDGAILPSTLPSTGAPRPTQTPYPYKNATLAIRYNSNLPITIREITLYRWDPDGDADFDPQDILPGGQPIYLSSPTTKTIRSFDCSKHPTWRGVIFDIQYTIGSSSKLYFGGSAQSYMSQGTCKSGRLEANIDRSMVDAGDTPKPLQCEEGVAVQRKCGVDGVQNCHQHWDGRYCRMVSCGPCME